MTVSEFHHGKLPARGRDHVGLDSLRAPSVECSNGTGFLSHGSEREHMPDTAPDVEPHGCGPLQDQKHEPDSQDNEFVFTDDELVELELLRDQEIDTLVDTGLLSKEDRWNAECRQGFTLDVAEMTVHIVTGDWYPVKRLSYEVKNISLPRIVVDQLRVALRGIHEIDARANTFKRWSERESSVSSCHLLEKSDQFAADRLQAVSEAEEISKEQLRIRRPGAR